MSAQYFLAIAGKITGLSADTTRHISYERDDY
jgi:hypothetical protein